jgi:hypothetical protein
VRGGAGNRSALRALSPQPATLRVATFPLQGKVICAVAPNVELRFRCEKFSLQEEATERKCPDITKTLAAR